MRRFRIVRAIARPASGMMSCWSKPDEWTSEWIMDRSITTFAKYLRVRSWNGRSQSHVVNAALSLKQASSTWISWLQPPQHRPFVISCRNLLPDLGSSESWLHPASPKTKDAPLLRSFCLWFTYDWIRGWGILGRLVGVAGRRGRIRHGEQLSRANEGPTPK